MGIGLSKNNHFATLLKDNFNADSYFLNYTAGPGSADSLMNILGTQYDVVILGIHQYKKYPSANFGVSMEGINLFNALSKQENVYSFVFGNPYLISNFPDTKNLVICYEDDDLMQETALRFIQGDLVPKGTLPVTVSEQYHFGAGQ